MREVNVTELRNHLPKYLSNIEQSGELLITSHGHVIARIMPPLDTQNEALKKLKILRKHCKVADVVSPIDEKWKAEE